MLLVGLVLGVLLMHHVPAGHGGHGQVDGHAATASQQPSAPQQPSASQQHTVTSQQHAVAGAHARTAAEHRTTVNAATDQHGLHDPAARAGSIDAIPAPQHDPLHLCLAILAGIASVLLPLLGKVSRPVVPVPAPRRGIVRARPRAPPSPVPRRLAVLCVLQR